MSFKLKLMFVLFWNRIDESLSTWKSFCLWTEDSNSLHPAMIKVWAELIHLSLSNFLIDESKWNGTILVRNPEFFRNIFDKESEFHSIGKFRLVCSALDQIFVYFWFQIFVHYLKLFLFFNFSLQKPNWWLLNIFLLWCIVVWKMPLFVLLFTNIELHTRSIVQFVICAISKKERNNVEL